MMRPVGVCAFVLLLSAAGCTTAKQAAPQPSATPVSASAYQRLLSGISAQLGNDDQLMSAALSSSSISLAMTIAEGDVSTAVAQLSRVAAPASMKSEQAGQIAALRAYGGALGGAARNVSADQICAGSAELAQLGQSSAVAMLRAHGFSLAMPQALADDRPANGALIRRADHKGPGDLMIVNTGGSSDAAVDLVLAGRAAAMAIYVHAASSATVSDVPDGSYEVYIATGTDWDPANHLFTRGCGFQKMDTPISFTTSTHGNTTYYSQDQITITPVVSGNVQMTTLAPAQFPQS
jgi:hypothetical protein